MTHRAVGFGRGFPRAWLLPIGALTILLGMGVFGRFSRSIVADLLAWWPIWIGLAVVAYLLRSRQVGVFRVAGLVPLLALGLVVLFAWGHVAGWSIMPSASQHLVGPDPGSYSSAELSAAVDGHIDVGKGSETVLYRVDPIRHGGRIGVPQASESEAGGSLVIDLVQPEDPGLYTYSGWEIALSPEAAWSLDLEGAVDADLADIDVFGLHVDGSGFVVLGETNQETPVTIDGDFRLEIPAGSSARVVGTAAVPASWTLTEDGAVSGVGPEGWVITVVGDSHLTVSETAQ